jgi:hypothetical protein
MCHVVQAYRSRENRPPGWVVEGVADYVRWFVYEPENKRPRVRNPDRAKHTDSYQTTAAFFNWIVKTKDKTFVKRLNLGRSSRTSAKRAPVCARRCSRRSRRSRRRRPARC